MRVGVPTEIKNNEFRVAITPAGVHALTDHGHQVLVQRGAGLGSSITDAEYLRAGATIIDDPRAVWDGADMILKVKEPVPEEYELMHEGMVLFTYLHLAANRPLTQALLDRRITSIAYETVETDSHALPLLSPMSEIAGRLATQVGAHCLMQPYGGKGTLLGGGTGVHKGDVVVLGGGVVGLCAARVAIGMGARVRLFDVDEERMRYIEEVTGDAVDTEFSTSLGVGQACSEADLVIGSVLVPGARTPHLVSHEMVTAMSPGSVLVDVAIDQGGCFADSHPTTHDDPTFRVADTVFYCVANMPGAVPHTATHALTNATLRYATLLADTGWQGALTARPDLARGLTTYDGKLVSVPVGQALGIAASPIGDLIG
ncbi:alanine dehydrogenase [Acidipropionibacterium jensenii]|uniref:alanine dehydrogenase n=1 Tax=Acidipropionibacterium jensenii TaxID=1749 RepID=UPI0026480CAC|nr:alanine dehydrogenase [Acidipropionibacterium jensenii]MDN5996170.1 alanine dehydrogenase [Acidipropionibacterium jensenii]MDN6658759.1 alanine dehydrogenase [Acidipropionibacterium jensenii]